MSPHYQIHANYGYLETLILCIFNFFTFRLLTDDFARTSSLAYVRSLFSLATLLFKKGENVRSLFSLATVSSKKGENVRSLFSLATVSFKKGENVRSLFSLATVLFKKGENVLGGVQPGYSIVQERRNC